MQTTVRTTVLLAEDEPLMRERLEGLLQSCWSDADVVAVAENGNDAWDSFLVHTPQVVFLDIRMPGKSGYEIFAAVKEAHPGCPVIFMTGFGYDPNHSIIRASKEGLSAVLYKPFKVDQLLTDVRAAISPGKR